MKMEKEVLAKRLDLAIKEYGSSRKITQQVIRELKNKNMVEGDINAILQLAKSVRVIPDNMLYAFTKALFNATKDKDINPFDFFTKVEIEDWDKWKQEKARERDKQPIVFKNCIQIDSTTWLTSCTNHELRDMFEYRDLTYNINTQRPLKITERNGRIIERIDINPVAVHQIADLISDSLFIPDPLTVNALDDGKLSLEIDERNGTITFLSGELNLTDGNHRMRGEFKALVKSPTLLRNIPILLTKLPEDRAKEYIYQKSRHNPINKSFAKAINPNRYANQIVEHINTNTQSLLRGRVTKDNNMLKAKDSKAIVEFSVLADVIDYTFKPEQIELAKLNKFISGGLNYIISIFNDLLKNSSEPKVWATYICMLYLVKDRTNWEEILDNLLTETPINDIPFKNISQVGIRNLLIEIKKYLPVNNEGVDNNE